MIAHNPLFPQYDGFDLMQYVLVSLIALGMALAFIISDRQSRTSRALALAFCLIGLSTFLGIVVGMHWNVPVRLLGWFGLADAGALIAMLEWILRVRRTVPVGPATNVRFGDRLLRAGQAAGVVYAVLSVAWPEGRIHDFLGALADPGALRRPGFWVFMVPIVFGCTCAAIALLLLLNRRPDPAERARVRAMLLAIPFLAASLVTGLEFSALALGAALMAFLVGAIEYSQLLGQRGAFMSRFLSPQVAAMVRDRGLESAMEQKSLEVTVVCCDIRGFTPYAQANPPTRVINVLREYYDAVGKVVAEFGATIKDFAGDGILILIGAPLPVPDQAQRGIEMARRIRETAREVVKRHGNATHRLGLGVGVATGPVAVGIIGSSARLEYTAVGPAVNLGSRLCELALDGEILIDSRTGELAGQAGLNARDPLPVKGYEQPVPLFAVAA
jgi:class 3 adenylate cyclase